jgi:carbamoyl-phosphate synthase small subunit
MRAAVDREDAPGAELGWLDWLTDCGVPAITDLDTRALVRHIRDKGAMRGGVFPARSSEAEARALIARRAVDGPGATWRAR